MKLYTGCGVCKQPLDERAAARHCQVQRNGFWTPVCSACWRQASWLNRAPASRLADVLWGRRIGRSSWLLAPGYGHCYRCHTNWAFVPYHLTMISLAQGMFPLCQPCWEECTPEQRVPFYRQLWQEWRQSDPGDDDDAWQLIEQAVLNERSEDVSSHDD